MEKVFEIAGLLTPILLFGVMLYSWWIIYDKMGEKGWVCLIPFYGRYLLFRRVWEDKIYYIYLSINVAAFLFAAYTAESIITAIVGAVATGEVALAFGHYGLLIFTGIFGSLAFLIQMMLNLRMAKCFGRGFGYFLGLTFLPVIFLPVLAFGRSYYDYY